MSDTETDGMFSYTDDADFAKKFAIASLCAFGVVVVVPGLLFLGYLAQAMRRATLGRKGLPEWTNFGELFSLGAVGMISLVYLLPAALLVALSVLPTLGVNVAFFSISAVIRNFILFGALFAFAVGLTFTVTAFHTYLSTGKVTDIFDFQSLIGKISSKKADLGFLVGLAAFGVTLIGLANWALPNVLAFLGWVLWVVGPTFLALMVSYGTGYILGKAMPQLPESAEAESEAESNKAPSAAVEEPPAEVKEPEDDGGDRWIPT